jgi:NAD(P)-dependent dehydrogenase (short-subunit alcohol dehydrogenase family)
MNLFIVSGASRGLGAALRDELARDTNNLVFGLSREPSRNTPPMNLYADLGEIATIAPAFGHCVAAIAGKQFERAVLINNAGVIGPVGRFDAIAPLETAANISINLAAPMALTQLFANATRSCAKQRLVVNISSGAAKRAIAGWSAYCAAKAGLEMATRVAALEVEPGLAICSLAPGVIDTGMQEQVRHASEAAFPEVGKFRAMKADGTLRGAASVARDILKLIESGKLTNGGNFDIREMTA